MDRLLKIARSATPESGIQFRTQAYGNDGIRSFLRDVLALANASVEGNRYIVVGVDFDGKGRKRTHAVDSEDFSGKPSYQSLANEFIEPPIRIRYKPVSFDGVRVGVFEIGDCQDRPYMIRADFSEQLRRGDAYKRVKNAAVKMGRRQLMDLFERKFRDSVSAGDVEVGFPGRDNSQRTRATNVRPVDNAIGARVSQTRRDANHSQHLDELRINDNGRSTYACASVRHR